MSLSGKKVEVWKLLKSDELFSALPWVRVCADTVRLPSNRVVDDFYRVDLPEYVMVCAMDGKNRILLERQYKHALKKITLALPTGCLEKNELPKEAVKREFLEETGYTAKNWQHIGSFTVDGNKGCGRAHFYIARDLKKIREAVADDMEMTEVVFMPADSVIKAIREGEISLLATVSLVAMATNPLIAKALKKNGRYSKRKK